MRYSMIFRSDPKNPLRTTITIRDRDPSGKLQKDSYLVEIKQSNPSKAAFLKAFQAKMSMHFDSVQTLLKACAGRYPDQPLTQNELKSIQKSHYNAFLSTPGAIKDEALVEEFTTRFKWLFNEDLSGDILYDLNKKFSYWFIKEHSSRDLKVQFEDLGKKQEKIFDDLIRKEIGHKIEEMMLSGVDAADCKGLE